MDKSIEEILEKFTFAVPENREELLAVAKEIAAQRQILSALRTMDAQ